jgi:hypothetical protein
MPTAVEKAVELAIIEHDLQQFGTGTAVGQIPTGTPIQIPIGTPAALLLIAAALEFLPNIIGASNLGASNQTTVKTIEHDFQHLVTDIVGILHHPQETAF